MNPTIEIEKLPPAAQKILDPKAPPALRQMAAKGISPGLRPHDALTVIALLAESEDEAVRATARTTLERLPAPLLNGALAGALLPGVIDAIAVYYARDAAVMEKILMLPGIAMHTVVGVAAAASEPVAELIATNEERLLKHPEIIEKLYLNKATRMSTADRLIELAVRNKIELTGVSAYEEAAAAIAGELISEPSPEPTIDDIVFNQTALMAEALDLDTKLEDTHVLDEETGEEKIAEKVLPLHAQLAAMTISQRIRRAMLGTSAERALLVRDTNKLVALAAVKSPMIQENEIIRISTARNVSDSVLSAIARSKQWSSNHTIKFNLVANPRTPFLYASKFIGHLREDELKVLAKSKNTAGIVIQAAKQQLQRRKKS
jgi:hypothetical protein